MNISNRLFGLTIALGCSLLVASVGASLTEIGPWYLALKQPSWKPPDFAFGIIWSAIFTLCAFSGWGAWQVSKTSAQKFRIAFLFALNSLLNILWSWLYFNQHRPDWAMTELYFLWASVLLLIAGLWRMSKISSALLVPYLVWVTTAGFLNAGTVELNGPFA
ncbi:TspO/MBR family protein [Limnohabitans sp. Rim8]|uniref:TspO/MBR family protein n=1 Tax=Limnohabitans sp. Rim8 TaxID=1100718 RepID=UPI0026125E90|nr:TspO/MBR family protein [Limnohabitans sp. Rim8]